MDSDDYDVTMQRYSEEGASSPLYSPMLERGLVAAAGDDSMDEDVATGNSGRLSYSARDVSGSALLPT